MKFRIWQYLFSTLEAWYIRISSAWGKRTVCNTSLNPVNRPSEHKQQRKCCKNQMSSLAPRFQGISEISFVADRCYDTAKTPTCKSNQVILRNYLIYQWTAEQGNLKPSPLHEIGSDARRWCGAACAKMYLLLPESDPTYLGTSPIVSTGWYIQSVLINFSVFVEWVLNVSQPWLGGICGSCVLGVQDW